MEFTDEVGECPAMIEMKMGDDDAIDGVEGDSGEIGKATEIGVTHVHAAVEHDTECAEGDDDAGFTDLLASPQDVDG